jgi:glycine reductase
MAKYRIVHYVNQFYGGFGGEDTAGMGIEVRENPVGPGLALQAALGEAGTVVATVICGDNYATENLENVTEEILKIVEGFKPDIFVAGPGFNAGRYGLICGAVTSKVAEQLLIPSVTALYQENPGTDLYKDRCYILKTDNNARDMKKVISELARFVLRLAAGEVIGKGDVEHYHGNGPAPLIDYSLPAPRRGVDMLLAKHAGCPFKTEVVIPSREPVPIPRLHKPLSEIKLALVTDGGLVPKGNPDKMVPTNSTMFKSYPIEGKERLDAQDYEVSHQGYNNAFVLQNPNRLVPLDAARTLVARGEIGELLEKYYTTAGVMTPMGTGKKFGENIAKELKEADVDAVLLVST